MPNRKPAFAGVFALSLLAGCSAADQARLAPYEARGCRDLGLVEGSDLAQLGIGAAVGVLNAATGVPVAGVVVGLGRAGADAACAAEAAR